MEITMNNASDFSDTDLMNRTDNTTYPAEIFSEGLNVTNFNNTSEIIDIRYLRTLPLVFGYSIIAVTFCSVITCSVVVFVLVKSNSRNFFKWKVLDRFSMYNAVGDFMLYAAQTVVGTNKSITARVLRKNLSGLPCTIHAISIYEFAFAQIILGLIMAIYAFVLINNNKHISFGRYDYRLLVPLFGIPLAVLVFSAYYDQFEPNIAYCGFKEQQGFATWHFITNFLVIAFSFFVIVILYTILWCNVYRKSKENSATLGQRSAVNSRRLGFKISIYVAIYCIQFSGCMVEGLWVSFSTLPVTVRCVIILFGACGGIMNGIVYLTIRRK